MSQTRRGPGTPARPTSTFPNAANQSIAPEAARLSRRARSLLPCGHTGDPFAGCHRCEPVTDRDAEAAAEALDTLDRQGLPGLADASTCRGLWRIGRRDLAVAVHRRTTGEEVS